MASQSTEGTVEVALGISSPRANHPVPGRVHGTPKHRTRPPHHPRPPTQISHSYWMHLAAKPPCILEGFADEMLFE